jgi:uncharacterized RDD family membrane protein YckC
MEDTLDLDIVEDNVSSYSSYADFWQRFAAYVLDGVIIIFICSSLKWVIADSLRVQLDWRYGYEDSQDVAYYVWSFYLIIIRWSYFAGMESSKLQATIGKLAVGLYVTGERKERISFAQASGRYFGKLLSGLLLGIGYIIAAFNPKKQALHDQMSNCYVHKK